MINRRKVMLASLAGVVAPIGVLYAQQPPGERHEGPADEHGPNRPDQGRPGPVEHSRPHMPPPRHEDRPARPGPEAAWHWRDGHWNWDGRRWVWASGRWYR
jgi:hypothetical protein